MASEGQTGPGLERVWAIWSRRKWLAILVFAFPCVAVVSLVTFLPSVYLSSATVLVDRQQVPEEFVRPTVTSTLETRLQTISQEILSRSRLEGLIKRFGLYADLRTRVSPEEVIERMRREIRLDLRGAEARERRATIAFAISYRGSEPQVVAQVTNTLASFYIEENLKVRERQASGTAEFLKIQLDETKKRLDEQERKVSDFKKRFVGQLPQEMEVNLATLERLNTQLRLNTDSQSRALERREAIARQMIEAGLMVPGGAVNGGGSGAMAAPQSATALRIARLRQELTELRTRFSDKYPDVVRLKAEIAELELQLAQEKLEPQAAASTAPPPRPPVDPMLLRMKQALAEAEADVKVLKSEEERLRAAIAVYQRRVQETPQREQQYKEMARDYDSTRELYASLLKRFAEAQIAESMEQRQKGEQFRLLDPAIASGEPAAPNRVRLILVGVGLSLGLAAVAMVLAEQLDTSFHEVDDLRAFTTVPVLAGIPRIETPVDRRRRLFRLRLATISVVVGLVVIAGAAYAVARGNEQLVGLLASGRS